VTTKIPEALLEVREYVGPGYAPVVDYGEWRVAILRYEEQSTPEKMAYIEQHNETDEVFVLLQGKAILFIGEGEKSIQAIHACDMQPLKIYNVKKSTWHSCTLSRDGVILIVENRNTAEDNSGYIFYTPEQREDLIRLTAEIWG